MRASEKTELILIGVVVSTTTVLRTHLPQNMQAGYFVLVLGVLFLFQTLIRDIWLLFRLRTKPRTSMPVVRCMCLESAVGFVPVMVSAILMFSGLSRPITLPSWAWPLGAALTLLIGFWLKDYVFEWNPWRIRKDSDHVNLRFSWRFHK